MKARLTPELLADCMAEVESGRLSVDDCVAANPGVAGELRSLLLVAGAVATAPRIMPDRTFRLRGRRELVAAISGSTPGKQQRLLPRVWYWMFPAWGRLPQTWGRRKGMPAFIIAIIIMAITSVAGGGAVYASRDALPGDALYQVKTTLEGLQDTMATTDEAKLQLHLDLARKRLAEIRMASQAGNQVAAGQAAEALAQELTRVEQHLNRAEASGKDVSAILAQVVEDIASQQKALAAEENLPEEVRVAVTKAGGATEQWREVVGSRAHGSSTEAGVLRTNAAATVAATAYEAAIGAVTAPTMTTQISETIGISLTEVISSVADLATNDPNISGQSYNGLLAKLYAAQAALDRGQSKVATNNLGAFVNQLNAFERSGHISDENYVSLYASYADLVAALGGTPKPAGHYEAAIGAVTAPTMTTQISETIGISLTEVISSVADLATNDPNISGQSYNGLLAKLYAAQAALDRGQSKVATNNLGAFVNQLNAFERSGHISDENYDSLYNSYADLAAALGGTPKPAGHDVPQANKKAGPKVSPESAATSEPTAEPDEQDAVREHPDHPDTPSNRGGGHKELDQQPSAASGQSGKKPAKH